MTKPDADERHRVIVTVYQARHTGAVCESAVCRGLAASRRLASCHVPGREPEPAPTPRIVVRLEDAAERGVVGDERGPQHAGRILPPGVRGTAVNAPEAGAPHLLIPHEVTVGDSSLPWREAAE